MDGNQVRRWTTAVAGGSLAFYGIRRRDRAGALLATLGGLAVYRAVANRRASSAAALNGQRAIRVERSVTISADASELYAFWRQLSRLPDIMRHLVSVTELSSTRSRWVAKGPGGSRVIWDAEIVDDTPGERISWRSLPGATVPNAGSVRFRAAPGGRGTEVHVTLSYEPPLGGPGTTVAKLFGEEPSVQVREDLRRFKQVIEGGEAPTIDGQPRGG